MRSIERIYNYFHFATWKLLNFEANVILMFVCYIMMKLFPFLKKNRDKGIMAFNDMFQNEDDGVHFFYSSKFMFLATIAFYASICLYIQKILNIKINGSNSFYYLSVFFLLVFLTEYCFIWRKDVYKKYFKEFKKIENEKRLYLHAILFHLGILLFTAFTVYMTVFVF